MRVHLRSALKIFSALVLFFSLACSHSEKKPDAAAESQPAAAASAATLAPPPAATSGFVAPRKVTCALKNDSRVLEVRSKDKGCELGYTKAGQENVIASSIQNGLGYCEKALEKLRDRLKEAGFECK